MKSNSRRYRRHRNPETEGKKETPFFSPRQKAIQTKEDAFFQPKLSVGQAGDSYEREADAVANKVVGNQPVQRKEISAVQAMPENKEEDNVQAKGAPEKKEEEKPVQKKGMPEKKEEEKPVQKKDMPEKKEEEKPVQKKEGQEKKEEEKPVQKKEEPEKKLPADEAMKEEKEEKGKTAVMAKESPSRGDKRGRDDLGHQLKEQRSKGNPLSPEVYNEMSSAIGADFGNVRIHTDDKAAELSNELGAQAFTHGNDVYFNSGKYDTESSAGKRLLAHELTHVVQQGAAPAVSERHSATAPVHAAPGVQRDTSTPLPEGVVPDEKSKVATFRVGDFTVIIKPDRKAKKKDKVAPNAARTSFKIPYTLKPIKNKKGKIESVVITKKLEIQTIYGSKANAEDLSAYGKGHIKSDVDAGNDSLGFHEGSHGQDFLNYIATQPFPEILIESPVTQAQYNKLKAEWKKEYKKFVQGMQKDSEDKTDNVTDPPQN